MIALLAAAANRRLTSACPRSGNNGTLSRYQLSLPSASLDAEFYKPYIEGKPVR